MRVTNAPSVVAGFAAVWLAEVMAPAVKPHRIGLSELCPE